MLSLKSILSGQAVHIEDHPSPAAENSGMAPWLTRAIFAGASLLTATFAMASGAHAEINLTTSANEWLKPAVERTVTTEDIRLHQRDIKPTAWSERMSAHEKAFNAASDRVKVGIVDWDQAETVRLATGAPLNKVIQAQMTEKFGIDFTQGKLAIDVDNLVASYNTMKATNTFNGEASLLQGVTLPDGRQVCMITPAVPDFGAKTVADQTAHLDRNPLKIQGLEMGFDPAKLGGDTRIDQVVAHEGGHCLGGSQLEWSVNQAVANVMNQVAKRAQGSTDPYLLASAANEMLGEMTIPSANTFKAGPPAGVDPMEWAQFQAQQVARAHVLTTMSNPHVSLQDVHGAIYEASAWARHVNEKIADRASVDYTGTDGTGIAVERAIGTFWLDKTSAKTAFNSIIKNPDGTSLQGTQAIDTASIYDISSATMNHHGSGKLDMATVISDVLAQDDGVSGLIQRDRQMKTTANGDLLARPAHQVEAFKAGIISGLVSEHTPVAHLASDTMTNAAVAPQGLSAATPEDLRLLRDLARAQVNDATMDNDAQARLQLKDIDQAMTGVLKVAADTGSSQIASPQMAAAAVETTTVTAAPHSLAKGKLGQWRMDRRMEASAMAKAGPAQPRPF